jgi:hypothetical protein
MTTLFQRSALPLGIAAFILAAVILMSIPALSFAATFAYVNTVGEVRTVTADTPQAALMTAPSIHMHSGVLLLDSPTDNEILDERVGV